MTDTICAAIIGAITGGIIGICATYFGNRLAKSTTLEAIKITEFNKAAVDFQCAFLEAKQQLRDDPKADWFNILNSHLLEHERATLRFRLFLSDKDRKCFDYDWNIYFSHRTHPGDRRPPEKSPEEWDDEENCKIFIEQIEKLLSYAKLK